jgi:hypothetical protein
MATIVDMIHPGDRVTIMTPQGQRRTGRAVMRGPAGWVLNMGGRYGTPAIADERNIVAVHASDAPADPPGPGPGPKAEQRIADRIDGYDRDDLGESPDY